MVTRRAEELLAAIRSLPTQERLRLVEQVIHDVAEAQAATAPSPSSLIGLFSDSADVIDQVCKEAMRARAQEPFRVAAG